MRSRFRFLVASGLLGVALVGPMAGCTSPGPIAARRNTVGSLKASVSQLEYANDNLKKQVADLKSDSTRFENELVQEREANGELSARLDDAKNVIRKQNGDVTALNRSSDNSNASTASSDPEVPPELKSAVRRSKSRRKPPTTQIPRTDSTPERDPGALELPTERVDPGPQASRDADDGRWLPVARARSRYGSSVEIR